MLYIETENVYKEEILPYISSLSFVAGLILLSELQSLPFHIYQLHIHP
jgi:hypothetical protein